MKKTHILAMSAMTAIAPLMLPTAAIAQDSMGAIFDNIAGQVTSGSVLLTVVVFVVGVALAFMGLLKFYANSKNPNDPSNKMSTAFILIFVGAALVAIPEVLGSGISTIWGGGASTTDATSGFTSLN